MGACSSYGLLLTINMSILDIIQDPTADWDRQPPAPVPALEALVAGSWLPLPDDYLTLLRYSNGGEGPLRVKPGWFQIWPAQEVLELNRAYAVPVYLPSYLGFGNSGGGEMLAFRAGSASVFMVPFIGLEHEYACPITNDFAEFVRALGHDEPPVQSDPRTRSGAA